MESDDGTEKEKKKIIAPYPNSFFEIKQNKKTENTNLTPNYILIILRFILVQDHTFRSSSGETFSQFRHIRTK
jgi:hypothetical protein